MSRDAIAEVLGRLDYGDHPDDVDWRDRLREVDGLLDAGVVIDVEDLLLEEDWSHWHDLRRVLRPLGWRPMVTWVGDNPELAWVMPGTDRKRVDAALTPYVRVSYGIAFWPALGDDADTPHRDVDSADELLAWLATP